ncbi:DUF2867 domain-containing protein [Aeromicrobium sp. A1-2]|uniref:DUF2867 domain-containing protein n=1 Tax=Aeromicrobium sp. A1-2 TaxID=2107713 RepID=UPI0013C2B819|nr:DUF2867 domain-containing protein [Aeromicrobium sp. A1-2]
MRPETHRVHAVATPKSPLLTGALPRVDWSDAYAVPFPGRPPGDPQDWAAAIFHSPPSWVVALLGVREVLVRAVGMQRGGSHAFDPVARSSDEVLLGIDQDHLGFRASVLFEPTRVVLSTIVQVHNRRGRAYWALVRWVHPVVVRSMLARAARTMAESSPV